MSSRTNFYLGDDVYSIGEFSKITGLTVKTLRFYHAQGILTPRYVDGQSGYRYYELNQSDTAQVITQLRALEFSISEIAEILKNYDDESDILGALECQRDKMQRSVRRYEKICLALDTIITREREVRQTMKSASYEVEEKSIDEILIAGVRMKGKYSQCGTGFAQIGKRFGRHIAGKPFLLHYDSEFKEDDADFEACMPIRKGESAGEVSVRQLQGGRCVSLLHKGPYSEIGKSYAKVLDYAKSHSYEIACPTREVYIKGPGMIFKGNPKNYLTEIQLMIQESN